MTSKLDEIKRKVAEVEQGVKELQQMKQDKIDAKQVQALLAIPVPTWWD